MKYKYYRCVNCGALVTTKKIKDVGKCSKCGKIRVSPAYCFGYNMPRFHEWPLILLGLR